MAYPLGQPLDSLSASFSSVPSFLSVRPIFAPFLRARFLFLPPPPIVYYPFPPCPYTSSLSFSFILCPSMNAPRGQPLVNLIILATPDKRRRQNVIPARSRSLFLVSNFKRCRYLPRSCILPHLLSRPLSFLLYDTASPPRSSYLIPIFFPFAVSEHRRSFIDTLQSVVRAVKFDKKT